MSRHLVVGLGEVGLALMRVLKENPDHEVFGIDREQKAEGKFDVLHISFPFNNHEEFIKQVYGYKDYYGIVSVLIIIHSSVPIGTTDCIQGAVHSPVRGVHPNLYEGLKTFVKYFGGERAQEAASYFPKVCGISTDSRNTEALKLWDTTYYGWNILFQKAIHKYCYENGLDYDLIYRDANDTYNQGYQELGRLEVIRPVLKHVEGKIGGHCVIPNARLLESEVATFLLEQNEQF